MNGGIAVLSGREVRKNMRECTRVDKTVLRERHGFQGKLAEQNTVWGGQGKRSDKRQTFRFVSANTSAEAYSHRLRTQWLKTPSLINVKQGDGMRDAARVSRFTLRTTSTASFL